MGLRPPDLNAFRRKVLKTDGFVQEPIRRPLAGWVVPAPSTAPVLLWSCTRPSGVPRQRTDERRARSSPTRTAPRCTSKRRDGKATLVIYKPFGRANGHRVELKRKDLDALIAELQNDEERERVES